MCQVKDTIQDGFMNGYWVLGNGEYTVSGCYNWLREKVLEVEWYKSIWISIAAPKHSFMAWLITNQALRLKDRLYCYNVVPDDLCYICALSTESHLHLFQECSYTKQITSRRWSKGRKTVTNAAVLVVWYMVWMQRNSARLTQQVMKPSVLAGQIFVSLKCRIQVCNTKSFSIKDGLWLSKVQ
ncbi:uncharacterized protein LOC141630458 [Silene latifolia]|uniref:uncharacterized protein LOC141630458 n=1 Tax=Silene latifolia TaxID=37657 RepID=UPI003D7779C1